MTFIVPARPTSARTLSRRRFFSVTALAGAVTVATAGSARAVAGGPAATAAIVAQPGVQVTGADLSGWQSVLGDALYAAPGQTPVSAADIALINSGSLSTLRANVQRRGVMAHNIAFKRVIDDTLLDQVHSCTYQFRLPYLPVQNAWPDNAQTVEGGFFVWDGGGTRRDFGLAFQWVLNPWQSNFGTLNTWTGSGWQATGYLAPDTGWHQVGMSFDRRNNLATMDIDGTSLPTQLTATPKPSDWGTETAARLQAEVISLWPGKNPTAPSHRAEVRNWTWTRNAYA